MVIEIKKEYRNNRLIFEAQRYVNDNGVVVFHGRYHIYHTNGQIFNDYTYYHGKHHGPQFCYDNSGVLLSVQNYTHGQPTGLIKWRCFNNNYAADFYLY